MPGVLNKWVVATGELFSSVIGSSWREYIGYITPAPRCKCSWMPGVPLSSLFISLRIILSNSLCISYLSIWTDLPKRESILWDPRLFSFGYFQFFRPFSFFVALTHWRYWRPQYSDFPKHISPLSEICISTFSNPPFYPLVSHRPTLYFALLSKSLYPNVIISLLIWRSGLGGPFSSVWVLA